MRPAPDVQPFDSPCQPIRQVPHEQVGCRLTPAERASFTRPDPAPKPKSPTRQ